MNGWSIRAAPDRAPTLRASSRVSPRPAGARDSELSGGRRDWPSRASKRERGTTTDSGRRARYSASTWPAWGSRHTSTGTAPESCLGSDRRRLRLTLLNQPRAGRAREHDPAMPCAPAAAVGRCAAADRPARRLRRDEAALPVPDLGQCNSVLLGRRLWLVGLEGHDRIMPSPCVSASPRSGSPGKGTVSTRHPVSLWTTTSQLDQSS